MRKRLSIYLMAIALFSLFSPANGALAPYSQSFEDLVQTDPDALGNDGWLIYGNVFTPEGGHLYGYGTFPAPNHSLAFSQIALGESGETQGAHVLSVFSDYENTDHANGNLIESNVFQEQVVGADDIGTTWRFVFEHKRGNIEGATTAQAFIKTLDPSSGYALTNFFTVEMTSIPDTWGADSLEITIDASLENQLLQIGFVNTASNYEGSGIFYDNLVFNEVGAPEPSLEAYTQDFEGLDQASPTALAEDGWLVFGNVSAPDGTYLYGYGPNDAPNHSLAFCQITLGEGGEAQGEQVLAVFSDYENADHAAGNLIESIVYQEQVITGQDIGTAWRFAFDHKRGNLAGGSTAEAFIKTLDPGSGYVTTNYLSVDMTTIPDTWGADSLEIFLGPDLENQLLQIGFANIATSYEGSAIFYDNIRFTATESSSISEERPVFASLRQNAPNPFDRSTSIEFSLERAGLVELSILDITGRRIATLFNGAPEVGGHQVTWNGTTSNGQPAPSGTYWYVLRTANGSQSGRMILTK